MKNLILATLITTIPTICPAQSDEANLRSEINKKIEQLKAEGYRSGDQITMLKISLFSDPTSFLVVEGTVDLVSEDASITIIKKSDTPVYFKKASIDVDEILYKSRINTTNKITDFHVSVLKLKKGQFLKHGIPLGEKRIFVLTSSGIGPVSELNLFDSFPVEKKEEIKTILTTVKSLDSVLADAISTSVK